MSVLKKSHVVILVHVICWSILAGGVLYAHPPGMDVVMPRGFWVRQTILLVLLIETFYVNLYVLTPRFLFNRKIGQYILLAVLLVCAATALNNLILSVFDLNRPFFTPDHPPFDMHDFPRRGPHLQHIRPDHPNRFDTFVPGMMLLMVGLGVTISFIQKWQQEVTLRQQLEQEKTSTELTLLKAQINPHFFFNTLNTIYSYTLSDGDVARTAITNLSKMMRYVLYDAAGRHTLLSKEIAFISEYVELMKLRISKKTSVLVKLQERGDEAMIAPMLFLPFVENAFKHGTSGIEEGYISIWILQHDDSVELITRNTVYKKRSVNEDESNGIGILNTTRRLQLLYPGKYTLSTGMISETEFEAKLKLVL